MVKKYIERLYWKSDGSAFYPEAIQWHRADLYQLIGRWNEAEAIYGQILEWRRRTEDLSGMALCYNKLGDIKRFRLDILGAERCYRQALDLYKQCGDLRGLANTECNLGGIHYDRGHFQEAQDYYRRSLDRSRETGETGIQAKSYCRLGLLAIDLAEYEEALQYLKHAEKIYQSLKSHRGLMQVYGNMGNIHLARGELETAGELFRQALSLALKLGDKQSLGLAMGSLSHVYMEENKYEEAINCSEVQQRISLEIGDLYQEGVALANLGSLRMRRGDLDGSEGCFSRMAQISKYGEDPASLSYAQYNLGLVCKYRGELERAITHLTQAVDLGREIGFKQYLGTYLYELAEVHWLLGQGSEATEACRLALGMAGELGRQDIVARAEVLRLCLKDDGFTPEDRELVDRWIVSTDSAKDIELTAVVKTALFVRTGREEFLDSAERSLSVLGEKGWLGLYRILKERLEAGQNIMGRKNSEHKEESQW